MPYYEVEEIARHNDYDQYIVTYDYGTNQYPLYTSAAAFLITVR
jgi:hypothetical protein